MIGEKILHYRIVEKLGEGGMGEVWKAQDTRLDRFVALKFLPEKTAKDPSTVERFLREARAASALNHPGICTIHDVGEWEGRRYIVMEFMEGETLGEKASHGALDIEIIVETGIQLCQALDAAHGKNIIHRDIKATNIMLTEGGQAKILDFGLAKILMPSGRADEAGATDRTIEVAKDITDAGQAVGTVSYMSPEQALGKDVDSRTDIFSLGVVLYEMATGRRAFPGSTTAAIFDAILHKSPTSPISINRDLPPEFERIINKALEKDRDLRYQSAADLIADLKRMWRDGSSQTVSKAVATQRSGGRGKVIGLAVGAVIVSALAYAVYMGLSDRSPRPLSNLKSTPLTSLVGVEESGTWSPDGSFFAFSHSASGPADIYVMSVSGGDPVQLGISEADDGDPRWSPDNRWIAFRSTREGAYGIYLIPPLGGATQKLVDLFRVGLGLDPGVGSTPWSPDGRFYLFSKPDTSALASPLFKIDVDTREETQLTTPPAGSADMNGAWSFDGGQIAFTRISYEGSAILVMSAEGGDIREALPGNGAGVIPEGNFGLAHPAWSPDSRSLIFEEMFLGAGVSSLWMVRLGSREPVQLVPGGANSGTRSTSAVVARSGRVLYNNYNHQTDLYARDLGSGEERRLTAHTRDSGNGRFSPDGKRIAYSSSRSGNFQIWILDLESGNETRLTNNTESDGFPEWSPGGDEIVFISSLAVGDGESGGHLWISSVGGGGPRLLSEQLVSGPPRWSPGGGLIGFLSPGAGWPTLWVLNRSTGEERKVLDKVIDFDWYRDDQHVIATTYNNLGVAEMRAVDLESGEYVTLLTDPQIELVVSPGGSAVSYCSSTSHYNMNLHILRLSPTESGLPRVVGAPEKITHGDGEWHVHNGGWSPDGKQVVYTRDTDRADMFLLEGVFGEEN